MSTYGKMKIFQTNKEEPKKKVKIFAKYMQRKLAFTFMVIALALFALCVVLVNINRNSGQEYAQTVLSQYSSYDSRTVTAARGEICDRNGTPLALNEKVYNLILDAKIILSDEKYVEATLDALAEAYGYEKETLRAAIEERSESHYVRYERQLSEEEKTRFEEIEDRINSDEDESNQVAGVWFEEEYKRVYPYDTLASQVLGFASSDGSSGNWGLEQYYNEVLIGTNGRTYGYLNEDSDYETTTIEPENGSTLISTIDLYVQGVVEKYIQQFNEEYGSRNTGVIVMDPNNGEVLAMATSSAFNLNDPYNLSGFYTEEEIQAMTDEQKSEALNTIWRNFCISDTYEPGSTAKAFTISSALEEGVVTPESHFTCDGYQEVGGYRIKCHYHAGHGDESLMECLRNSCNDASMQIGALLGVESFTRYQSIFNFGQRTGVDLPGEADGAGLIYTAENMRETDLATNSFGQNFNVTMMQMAAAYCSVVNGGNYYQPHLVKKILSEDGTVEKSVDKVLVKETISDDTSRFMREALLDVVANGSTARSAQVAGYSVGGKTGTAEKYPRGNGKYVVSFMGVVPAQNPEIIIYVVIDEPNTDRPNSNSWATNMSKNILTEILPYLNVYPESGEAVTPEDPFGEGEIQEPEEGGEDPMDDNGDVFDDSSLAPAGVTPVE